MRMHLREIQGDLTSSRGPVHSRLSPHLHLPQAMQREGSRGRTQKERSNRLAGTAKAALVSLRLSSTHMHWRIWNLSLERDSNGTYVLLGLLGELITPRKALGRVLSTIICALQTLTIIIRNIYNNLLIVLSV